MGSSKWKLVFTPVLKKRMWDAVKIGTGGFMTFCGINIYAGNEKFYASFVLPVLHQLSPETAHTAAILAAKCKLVPNAKLKESDVLKKNVFGLTFTNPVGLAAGFDKNGEAVEGLFKMGFGFVEIGSVTPLPQDGNPAPRIFRLPEMKGIVNRCGFNSDGHDVVYSRLCNLPPPGQRPGLLGINLGKNKLSTDAALDYILGVRKFGPVADYLVINISSPNTPGLRNLQKKSELHSLIETVVRARDELDVPHKPPILVKISPDLSIGEKQDIAKTLLSCKPSVDGLIVSNTTVTRPGCIQSPISAEEGGLSGEPLKDLAVQTLKDMAALTHGKIPIIGVGGISSAEDAVERVYYGASLIQIYTSFVYEGPLFPKRLVLGIEEKLRQDGFKTIDDAVGWKLKKL